MTIESPVQGSKANRLFNRIADGVDKLAKESWHHYRTQPLRTFGDTLNHEELAFALMFFIPAARTVQALASLSASVTGGRRRAPAVEPRRVISTRL